MWTVAILDEFSTEWSPLLPMRPIMGQLLYMNAMNTGNWMEFLEGCVRIMALGVQKLPFVKVICEHRFSNIKLSIETNL